MGSVGLVRNECDDYQKHSNQGIYIQRYRPVGCGLAALLVLTGCSAPPYCPHPPRCCDFGPARLATVPTDRRVPLAPLALADMDAPGLPGAATPCCTVGLCRRPAAAPYSQTALE